ncbi:MAG: isoprenylcysteine carboxylmethyltransferase family protein [Anaerolineales bacterium]|nr:isoprenylcysteine carboxylmethyltransferase family protein [Anaerolineales bacterium]
MTAFKSILFFIVAPGMLGGFIPLALLRTGSQWKTGILSYGAPLLWGIGLVMLIWCFWDFLAKGKGTPAPIDPPKHLVVAGFYRLVRNPMYVGVLFVLAGHFVWFGYWALAIYAVLFFLVVHTFVTRYEEPHLRKVFGAEYEEYCKQVSRWIPRIP